MFVGGGGRGGGGGYCFLCSKNVLYVVLQVVAWTNRPLNKLGLPT